MTCGPFLPLRYFNLKMLQTHHKDFQTHHKAFHSEYLCSHHSQSTINILLSLLYHTSVCHISIHLTTHQYIFDVFRSKWQSPVSLPVFKCKRGMDHFCLEVRCVPPSARNTPPCPSCALRWCLLTLQVLAVPVLEPSFKS